MYVTCVSNWRKWGRSGRTRRARCLLASQLLTLLSFWRHCQQVSEPCVPCTVQPTTSIGSGRVEMTQLLFSYFKVKFTFFVSYTWAAFNFRMVLSWWLLYLDGCFILMAALSWRLLYFDGCFILMAALSWRLLYLDGCFILTVALFRWLLYLDGCFILSKHLLQIDVVFNNIFHDHGITCSLHIIYWCVNVFSYPVKKSSSETRWLI